MDRSAGVMDADLVNRLYAFAGTRARQRLRDREAAADRQASHHLPRRGARRRPARSIDSEYALEGTPPHLARGDRALRTWRCVDGVRRRQACGRRLASAADPDIAIDACSDLAPRAGEAGVILDDR